MSDAPIFNQSAVTDAISEARGLTVQARVRHPENVFGVHWLARAGMNISPWWSSARDKQLREFWKKSDHLSGAVYTMQSKMTAIPFRVVPRDISLSQHVRDAEEATHILTDAAEFGEGWINFYGKFVEDLITQDNGAFAEVIGPGRPDGPIIGRPVTVAHLDSYRCQRTGDPEYPVIYHDLDQRMHKLHYTRVIYTSQMSSPIAEMFGVGFCSVSRCVNVAQTLIDILTFKQEKLGSRPHRSILIPQGGLDPGDVQTAFQMAEGEMDNMGLSRYSKIVLAGSSSLPEADIKVIELSSLPDGFDEETSITLGMATVALAFGVDARELFPGMSAGATRADALLQHLKQRGKGPGQILQTTEQLFNFKFLPPYLTFTFDFQDDAQDRQVADIKKVRAERRLQDLNAQTINVRAAREQMLQDGDLNHTQFERLELQDGRMADGTSILGLFFSQDPLTKKMLKLDGVDDPTDVYDNDPDTVLTALNKKLVEVTKINITNADPVTTWCAYRSLMALSYLEKLYRTAELTGGNIRQPSPFSILEKIDAQNTTPSTSIGNNTGNQAGDAGVTGQQADQNVRAEQNKKAPLKDGAKTGRVRNVDLTTPNQNTRSMGTQVQSNANDQR